MSSTAGPRCICVAGSSCRSARRQTPQGWRVSGDGGAELLAEAQLVDPLPPGPGAQGVHGDGRGRNPRPLEGSSGDVRFDLEALTFIHSSVLALSKAANRSPRVARPTSSADRRRASRPPGGPRKRRRTSRSTKADVRPHSQIEPVSDDLSSGMNGCLRRSERRGGKHVGSLGFDVGGRDHLVGYCVILVIAGIVWVVRGAVGVGDRERRRRRRPAPAGEHLQVASPRASGHGTRASGSPGGSSHVRSRREPWRAPAPATAKRASADTRSLRRHPRSCVMSLKKRT